MWLVEMHSFAHIADCHLGAYRDEVLRNLNLDAFRKAIDRCIEKKVDFIIIAGDLFHSNLPDMRIVKEGVEKLKEAKEKDIEIYIVYGSHDYSVTNTSIIDVLKSAGLLTSVFSMKQVGEQLVADFMVDGRTGAKIVGISARKGGNEREYYDKLDTKRLEKEKGFRIFILHTAIDELKPKAFLQMKSVPMSLLPKGFDYYAGGHVHRRIVEFMKEHGRIVFPGVLFGSDYKDLEDMGNKETGFYIVKFDENGIKEMIREDVSVAEILKIDFDASGRSAIKAREELWGKIKDTDFKKKIVLLKVRGVLESGRPSDLNLYELKREISSKGAISVYINRNQLSSKEEKSMMVYGESAAEIENSIFEKFSAEFGTKTKLLKGRKGVELSKKLLDTLKSEMKGNEKKKDYEERIMEAALKTLEMEK